MMGGICYPVALGTQLRDVREVLALFFTDVHADDAHVVVRSTLCFTRCYRWTRVGAKVSTSKYILFFIPNV